MFDVIFNEVKKYSPNARKLEAKADEQFERLNVIAIVQVKTESRAVKHAARFNLQRRIHVKPRLKQRSLKQNTLNFARIFCAAIKNFLAFTGPPAVRAIRLGPARPLTILDIGPSCSLHNS